MMTSETAILDQVTMDEPWGLVESFATFKREHPDAVNRGMDEVVERLSRHGVPATVHKPSLYLSLPGEARVEASGVTYRAKPPAYATDARGGVTITCQVTRPLDATRSSWTPHRAYGFLHVETSHVDSSVDVAIGGVDDGLDSLRLVTGDQRLAPIEAPEGERCTAITVEFQRCSIEFDASASSASNRVLVVRRGDEQSTWRL